MNIDKTILLRLVVAVVLGSIIGLEREVNKRPAGLRTHVLVALGSTLIMIISIGGPYNQGNPSDPYRLAAQVVSGIGFLGAGTIIQREDEVDGLTTAATLWVSAGIGLAVGAGYILASILAVLIVVCTLLSLSLYERAFDIRQHRILRVSSENKAGIAEETSLYLGDMGVIIKGVFFPEYGRVYDHSISLDYKVKIPKEVDREKMLKGLMEIPGIKKVKITRYGGKTRK